MIAFGPLWRILTGSIADPFGAWRGHGEPKRVVTKVNVVVMGPGARRTRRTSDGDARSYSGQRTRPKLGQKPGTKTPATFRLAPLHHQRSIPYSPSPVFHYLFPMRSGKRSFRRQHQATFMGKPHLGNIQRWTIAPSACSTCQHTHGELHTSQVPTAVDPSSYVQLYNH